MNTKIEATQYSSELIKTPLVENGKPIRLHFIVHKPKGEGPFPVLVFNHGSTGHGTNPDDFVTHELYHPVSDFFVKRNWMVIIPHRRGRGDSDGKYDEGLDGNGYSSNFEVSMLGGNWLRNVFSH